MPEAFVAPGRAVLPAVGSSCGLFFFLFLFPGAPLGGLARGRGLAACAGSLAIHGGYGGGVPPLPIPNREVKPACADGTAMQCGRVGGRLFFSGWVPPVGFGPQGEPSFFALFPFPDPPGRECSLPSHFSHGQAWAVSGILCIFAPESSSGWCDENMLNRLFIYIRLFYRWLAGVGHGYGFGIQSPFAYSFVREVIGERWPYYAYEDLAKVFPLVQGRQLKFCRLLLRLSNAVQPKEIFLDAGLGDADAYAAYLSAGCRRSTLIKGEGLAIPVGCGLYVMRCEEKSVERLLSQVEGEALVVLTDIYESVRPSAAWHRVLSNEGASVVFDLCHLVMFFLHTRHHKSLYLLNF